MPLLLLIMLYNVSRTFTEDVTSLGICKFSNILIYKTNKVSNESFYNRLIPNDTEVQLKEDDEFYLANNCL